MSSIQTSDSASHLWNRRVAIAAHAEPKGLIRAALKRDLFCDPQDLVDVSDGDDDDVHVVIVSRKFDGRRMKEKHDLIWSELQQKLAPEIWGRISLSIGVSPEEIKAGAI